MSEQEQQQSEGQAKAKKGKLPIIIVLALVFAGGGFFAMKMKGGKPKKPEPKLGTVVELPKEFLVPLRGDGSYLRTDVALHFVEGFDSHALEAEMAPVRDAIIHVLMAKSKREMESLSDLKKLKKQIAAEVNKALASHGDHGAEEGEKHEEEGKGKKGHKDEKDAKPEKPKHPDWDSQEGPVLKVYFTTFATQ